MVGELGDWRWARWRWDYRATRFGTYPMQICRGSRQFLNTRGLRGSRGFVCMETSPRLIVGISWARLSEANRSFDECVRDFWASARSKVSVIPPGPPVCNKEDNHISKLDSLFEIPRSLIIPLSIPQVEDFLHRFARASSLFTLKVCFVKCSTLNLHVVDYFNNNPCINVRTDFYRFEARESQF